MSTARSSRRVALALVALAAIVALAAAAAAADDATPDDVQQRALAIAAGLRCPVCQNLSVADSTSETARDMRALIVDMVRAGKSPEEIRAYFVSKYGEWILLSPTPRGAGLALWLLPGVAAVGGVGLAAWTLRGWVRHRRVDEGPVDEAALARVRTLASADVLPAGTAPEEARLADALRELDFDHRAGKLSDGDWQELRALYERRSAAAVASRAAAAAATPAPAPAAAEPPGVRPARTWRLVTGGAFLLVLGVAVGAFLDNAIEVKPDGGAAAMPTVLEEGERALEAGDLPRATESFRQVLREDPEQPLAHAYLGLVLLRAGHADQALASFDRALAGDPRLAPALWGKGLVLYESKGRAADAIRLWETLLTENLSQEDRQHVTAVLAKARAERGRASPRARP